MFVGELDRNLRESQLDQFYKNTAEAANGVTDRALALSSRVRPESKTLLAALLSNDVLIDGYADDWSAFEMQEREFKYSMNKISVEEFDQRLASSLTVHAASRGNNLYLFVRVKDQELNFHSPASNSIASGDRFIIRVPDAESNIRRYTFRWEAPGLEVGRFLGKAVDGKRPILRGNKYRAALTESASGYQLELQMPMPTDGRFGFSVIDVDSADEVQRWTGMFDPNEPDDVGQLRLVDTDLNELLLPHTQAGMRIRFFNGQGWLLADADRRLPDASVRNFSPADRNVFDAVLYRFIAWSLARNIDARPSPAIASGKLGIVEFRLFEELAERAEFLRDEYQRVFHTMVKPVTYKEDLLGYLLVQQPRASLTAFTEAAILRLVKIFGLTVALVAFVMIGFASLLSWRVRKLRDSVENSVTRDGVIVSSVSGSVAADEIGDLSRSFRTIMNRLDNYTKYLQKLGSRLSHELRTPLSVVTTSLENIDKAELDSNTLASIERAGLGAARLQRLIRNLSEASSVEQTIQRSTKEIVDLVDWIAVARDVYDNLYPDRDVALQITEGVTQANTFASVELLHQMMDKLISNAVDFSRPGSVIYLHLHRYEHLVHVTVENTGSPLPVDAEELFEPMVSVRESRDDQPHMGFGLHIVKLIADFHQAKVSADNHTQQNTVSFTVSFPIA